ncbi:hypothetical protein [Halotia branconii]|uniref:Uncharacterized protein n=1 Tax=Halotia branconii CENA392 TaxID=1539056 RepID=A0AAJ6NYL0_9CYAN|nr:hypothetical protein [Halotia branconii]WGV29012.1 hypothetical protein QI031_31115 [Halotia branconii CENA392]
MSQPITNPQTLQTAIAAATNAHTGLHQAIHELRHGSVSEAKQLVARQIAVLANVLMVL